MYSEVFDSLTELELDELIKAGRKLYRFGSGTAPLAFRRCCLPLEGPPSVAGEPKTTSPLISSFDVTESSKAELSWAGKGASVRPFSSHEGGLLGAFLTAVLEVSKIMFSGRSSPCKRPA